MQKTFTLIYFGEQNVFILKMYSLSYVVVFLLIGIWSLGVTTKPTLDNITSHADYFPAEYEHLPDVIFFYR